MTLSVRVAIVDDELPLRIALGRLLRLAGCEVSLFSSGETFLASLSRERPPDCLILDLWMAGLSGVEVLHALREAKVATPVICITASADSSLTETVIAAGATRLLRKPIPNDELLDAIRLAIWR
jgi:two-component system response regulator FixJ